MKKRPLRRHTSFDNFVNFKELVYMGAQLLSSVKPDSVAYGTYHSARASGHMLDSVYALRYQAYSEKDYIDRNDTERFMDKYDAMTNCASFLTYNGEKLIGSIRICAYHPNKGYPIPVMESFHRELSEHIGMDKPFVEINRFVVHPEFQRKGGVRARFSIYKNALDQVVELQPAFVVAAVREEHMRFYKMLNFEPISEIKPYPGLKFKTVLMAGSDVARSGELILSKCNKSLVQNDILPFDRSRGFSCGAASAH